MHVLKPVTTEGFYFLQGSHEKFIMLDDWMDATYGSKTLLLLCHTITWSWGCIGKWLKSEEYVNPIFGNIQLFPHTIDSCYQVSRVSPELSKFKGI